MFDLLKNILISMRPHHWVKNIFIFAGLIFSGNLLQSEMLIRAWVGFFLFSFMSSSIYLFNDIIDMQNDKCHSKKSKRPIAAGKLNVLYGYLASVILATIAVLGSFFWDRGFLIILALYGVLNLVYTLKIKQIVILDVMMIAIGFVLRIVAGTTLVGVRPSEWLIFCTMTVSLFLGFSKRRQELVFSDSNRNNQQKILLDYSISFIDQMIAVVTASTIISYGLYTVSAETIARFGTRKLIFTFPFVLYGIFRYLYLIYHKSTGDNPTDIVLRDIPFILNGILWFGTVILIIYS
jgi:4-hydroxybenzoate polyprenyltransferase